MMNLRHFVLGSLALLTSLYQPVASATTIAGVSGINAFVDNIDAINGDIYNWQSVTPADLLTIDEVEADLTDLSESSYVFSTSIGAYIDMSFSQAVYNGAGADLVFFFVGDDTFTFGVDIDAGGALAVQNYTPELTGFAVKDEDNFSWNLSVIKVDLENFGYEEGQALDSPFRVFLGDEHKNPNRPLLSMAGAFHDMPPAEVPLPLPVILFASGLALLGTVARRRKS